MTSEEISIDGYFCVSKEYPPLDRLLLSREAYKEGVKRFDPSTLEITKYRKLFGTLFYNVKVFGVIDTVDGSLIPFFVDEKDFERLQACLKNANPTTTW